MEPGPGEAGKVPPTGWVKCKGAARVWGRHQLPQWLPSQASKCLGYFAWGDKEVGQWELGIAGFRAWANRKCKAVFSSPTHPPTPVSFFSASFLYFLLTVYCLLPVFLPSFPFLSLFPSLPSLFLFHKTEAICAVSVQIQSGERSHTLVLPGRVSCSIRPHPYVKFHFLQFQLLRLIEVWKQLSRRHVVGRSIVSNTMPHLISYMGILSFWIVTDKEEWVEYNKIFWERDHVYLTFIIA